METQQLISIIIPTFNRANLIGETLDSIIAQTYKKWECLIIDDGSADGTEEVINKYSSKDTRFQYHKRPIDKPKGANACRNYGFELSKGEYINWFDDDDIMLCNFLELKTRALTKNISFVICSGFTSDQTLLNQNIIDLSMQDENNLFHEYVLFKLKILTPSILFKKEFLVKERLFLTFLTRGQEMEFFSRIFFNLKVNSFVIINKPLFIYRQHQNNKTTKNKKYCREFKESESFIYIENLKKGILIKDQLLVQFCYKHLVNIFFKSIENEHFSNSKSILKKLSKVLKKNNKFLLLKWIVVAEVSFLIERKSYKFKKMLNDSVIQF